MVADSTIVNFQRKFKRYFFKDLESFSITNRDLSDYEVIDLYNKFYSVIMKMYDNNRNIGVFASLVEEECYTKKKSRSINSIDGSKELFKLDDNSKSIISRTYRIQIDFDIYNYARDDKSDIDTSYILNYTLPENEGDVGKLTIQKKMVYRETNRPVIYRGMERVYKIF